MNKLLTVIFFVLVAISVAHPQDQPTERWHQVAAYSGDGIHQYGFKEIPRFTISGEKWVIQYAVGKARYGYRSFEFGVNDTSDSSGPIKTVKMARDAVGVQSIELSGKGKFFIFPVTTSCYWQMTVWDLTE